MAEITKAQVIRLVKKGFRTALIITVVTIITLVMGGAGLNHAEKFTDLYHWIAKTKPLWLVWRLGLYLVLGWGGWKIWQVTKTKPEYRAVLIRIMAVSLLFILLGEYALSGHY
ncbi:hypothetical protein ID858_16115 [Xenorhabdus sp. DI]|uniref:hypothetical protein n=1 Tax=Xenorhabdus doucetiae TaxID=351671 RepID=UPI0019ADB9A0|nr:MULTISPECIES: hypothetical protein [unclassified Xenorhabdus]MBD2785961.1 hypothetical protein [Xenorhabdus sp. 3]MBD2790018.1 hypothetical protein [Xenorhabdus sp. DI]